MPPVMTRREANGRVREIYSAGVEIWACYARSGGLCFKPDGVPCPCDGWEPFLLSWRGIVNAIEGQLGDDVEDRPEWLKPRPPTTVDHDTGDEHRDPAPILMHGYCDECGGEDCRSVECERIRRCLCPRCGQDRDLPPLCPVCDDSGPNPDKYA